jgi:hypothetical protein
VAVVVIDNGPFFPVFQPPIAGDRNSHRKLAVETLRSSIHLLSCLVIGDRVMGPF